MDVIGIGIDLVRIPRIMDVDHRWGARFRKRVFTPHEIAYAMGHNNPFPHFAAQFAVKEAVLKAVGTGWKSGTRWLDIESHHAPSGEPKIRLSGKMEKIFFSRGGEKIFCSISHEHEYAIAHVVITGVPL